MKKHVKKQQLFLLSQLQHIINIAPRKPFYIAPIKPHIDYASVVWDGCGEVHLKKLNSLHQRASKLILPDPSLSTEQKMSALGILNVPQQLANNKGIFVRKVLNNNSSNYLAQLFISHQSHYTNSRNNSTCQGQRLTYLKLAYPSLERPSGTPCLKKIKSCIYLPCFKRNLHKYMPENNLSSNLDGFV